MSKMLLLVPRMYTEEEFKSLARAIPEDFVATTLEFWNYVEDKLKIYVGKIQKVYRDEICQSGKDALARLFLVHRENFMIAKKLIDNGATFEATEDSLLVAESKAWFDAIKHDSLDTIALEMYQETLRERDNYVANRIDETLGDGEIGILFIQPSRIICLGERVKIIKVCRFDPSDYLRAWQVKLKS